MNRRIIYPLLIVPLLLVLLGPWSAQGALIQCPGDVDMDGVSDDPNIQCIHLAGADGFAQMADGYSQYMFSFGLVDPSTLETEVVAQYTLKAWLPAPLIVVKEGHELYLTMTNVGMAVRTDLFDPHSIHWHGFQNAAPIFDGLPEPSPTPVMGASLTYYYFAAQPGNYFYHCHVEASEHMQMGMIGPLWVTPAQDELPDGTVLNGGFVHHTGYTYVYNDGDGSTYYDVGYPVQLTGFDSDFHDASETIQPLPFAAMKDNYPMINGRGYPDTINTFDPEAMPADPGAIVNKEGFISQRYHSLIEAVVGDKILLRVSNVSTTDIWAISTTLGVPLKVVGRGAELLRGPTGINTSYEVQVLNVGGGQAYDVIVSTAGVEPGTYFLYTTNLNFMCNNQEERGGLITEIVISPLI